MAVLVAFYLFLSAAAIVLAVKAIRTKQWPPAGLPVPFRTRIHEIRRPFKVWLLVAALVGVYLTHIALTGYTVAAIHSIVQESVPLVNPKRAGGPQ